MKRLKPDIRRKPVKASELGNLLKITAITIAFLTAFDARGQETAEERFEKFQLYTGCSDVGLAVEDIDENEAGLTREQVTTTVRSRLRGARIYDDADVRTPYLYVNVHVVGIGFSINIFFEKLVLDEHTGYRFPAKTWLNMVTGTHGRDAGYILQGVGEIVDIFIDEYLRVNEEACE